MSRVTTSPPRRNAPSLRDRNGARPVALMSEGDERVVVAGLLNGVEPPPTLRPADIASPPLRSIFEALLSLPPARRNLLGVCDALEASGELTRIGGRPWVTEVYTAALDVSCFDYSFASVMASSRQRRAAAIGKALLNAEITPLEASEQLAQLSDPLLDLPSIEDAAELVASEIVLPNDVIEGLLHRGAKMVLGGASKSYKTWLLVYLAVCVASGSVWLARATKRGRVLYINFEIQSGFFAKRIATILAHRRIEIEPGYLRVWNLRGYADDLSQLLSRLLQRIRRDAYDLIVIDPVYKVLGARDENKAGDVASMLNVVEVLAVRTGAAVAFGAHYSKGNQAGKESIDRIGGSGVFARDPDTILNFTRHEEDDAFTVEAVLRNHPPIEPFVVRWVFPVMEIDDDLDPAKLKQIGGREKVYDAGALLALLDRVPLKTSDWQQLAKSKLGMCRATFYRLRDELDIEKDDRGRWSRRA